MCCCRRRAQPSSTAPWRGPPPSRGCRRSQSASTTSTAPCTAATRVWLLLFLAVLPCAVQPVRMSQQCRRDKPAKACSTAQQPYKEGSLQICADEAALLHPSLQVRLCVQQ